MPSLFLSHSSLDKPFARKLADGLERGNVRVWFDEAELRVGDSLIDRIGSAIDQMDFFGVILSKNSVASEWVQRELKVALTREFQEKNTVVLPFLMERVEIPAFLRDKVYADFTTPERFDLSLARVLVTIHGRTASSAAAPEQPRTRVLLKSDAFYRDLDRVIRSVFTRRIYFSPGIPPDILQRATFSCHYHKTSSVLCVIDYENSVFMNKGRTAVMFSREGIHIGGRTRDEKPSHGFVRYEDVGTVHLHGSSSTIRHTRGGASTTGHISIGDQGIWIPSGTEAQSAWDFSKVVELIQIVIDKHTV